MPSAGLPETITEGDANHIPAHTAIHKVINAFDPAVIDALAAADAHKVMRVSSAGLIHPSHSEMVPFTVGYVGELAVTSENPPPIYFDFGPWQVMRIRAALGVVADAAVGIDIRQDGFTTTQNKAQLSIAANSRTTKLDHGAAALNGGAALILNDGSPPNFLVAYVTSTGTTAKGKGLALTFFCRRNAA
jgi:hypothetical protein